MWTLICQLISSSRIPNDIITNDCDKISYTIWVANVDRGIEYKRSDILLSHKPTCGIRLADQCSIFFYLLCTIYRDFPLHLFHKRSSMHDRFWCRSLFFIFQETLMKAILAEILDWWAPLRGFHVGTDRCLTVRSSPADITKKKLEKGTRIKIRCIGSE